MISTQQLLVFIFSTCSLFRIATSTTGNRNHNHHRYDLSTYSTAKNATDDDEITNEDTILDVSIIPPLRLNIFETPKVLSDSGKKAIIKAMNEHATYRLQIYFRETIYFFDQVEFELIESHTVEREVPNKRNLRVFEKEELDAREDTDGDNEEQTSLRRTKDIDFLQSNNKGNEDGRNLQQTKTIYGTSLLLGGKIKFSLFPSASSAESNKQLYDEMQRDWFMHKYIEAQAHSELKNVKQWLINTNKETAAPSPSPSAQPSKIHSDVPSLSPISSPSSRPSSRPSLRASSMPSSLPSMNPTSAPSESPKPSQQHAPSSSPSSIPTSKPFEESEETGSGLSISDEKISNENNDINGSIIPIIVASALVSLVIFIGSGMFIMKNRKENHLHSKIGSNKELTHKRLNDDDNDDEEVFEDEDPFEARIIPSLLSTKDESNSMDSSEELADDYYSETSAIADSKTIISVASSQTMKANNVSGKEKAADIERKWMSPSKNSSFSPARPPKAPSSANKAFPIKLDSEERLDDIQGKGAKQSNNISTPGKDDVSPTNISLQVVGAASAALSSGNNVGPNLMKFFVRSDRGDGSKTHSRNSSFASQRSSPITTVTPSKVSKEEFEKGWDVDLPLNWDQKEIQTDPKMENFVDNDDIENAFNAFNDVDGSFPTFDENDQPNEGRSPEPLELTQKAAENNERLTRL